MSKENTNDSILVMLNPDGLAEIYDDTYDITIHCESLDEQETVSKMLGRLQGWIPVEERLPNEEEFREAYCRNAYAAEFLVMIKGATRPTTLYFREGCWFDSERNYYDVIAWMPLPEPYKGGENE